MENGNLVPPIVKPPSHVDFYMKSELSNLKKLNQSVSSAGDDDDEEMKVDGETIERFFPYNSLPGATGYGKLYLVIICRLIAVALSNSSKTLPVSTQPSIALVTEPSAPVENETAGAVDEGDVGSNQNVEIENHGSTEGNQKVIFVIIYNRGMNIFWNRFWI